MYIYKTINKITNKSYVGQRNNKKSIEEDFNYIGTGTYFKRSIKKYGRENFQKEILQECFSQQELDEAERFWIAELNTLVPNGYNLLVGGSMGCAIAGSKRTKEHKRKIGLANEKSQIGNKNATGKRTQRTCINISEGTREGMTNMPLEKKIEMRRKQSLAQIGIKHKPHKKVICNNCFREIPASSFNRHINGSKCIKNIMNFQDSQIVFVYILKRENYVGNKWTYRKSISWNYSR